MKYTVHYGRKTKLADYDMLEIGLSREFDDSVTPVEAGYAFVRDQVEAWIREETGEGRVEKPAEAKPTVTVESVAQAFPKELKSQLYFEDAGEYVVVRSRKYLGQEDFKRIAEIVQRLGGEYISAGKDSHFRIRRT